MSHRYGCDVILLKLHLSEKPSPITLELLGVCVRACVRVCVLKKILSAKLEAYSYMVLG